MMAESAEIKTEPLVSIVTPVYNGEKFISECIESILGQTYTNFEYKIFNNKSTDRTLEIVSKYAQMDKRITIYNNNQLLPVMKNFNRAISHISKSSKYCKLVCADDWISEDHLLKTVELAENNPNVGMVSSYRLVGRQIVPGVMLYGRTVFNGRELGRMNFMGGPYTFGPPTAILFRSEIVLKKDKFYNEERTSGDAEACYEILREWDFGFVPQVLSFYRIHDDSITSQSLYLRNSIPDLIYMLDRYGKYFLDDREFEFKKEALTRKYFNFLGQNINRFRDAKFKSFHKKQLETLNLQRNHLLEISKSCLFHLLKNTLDLKSHLKIIYSLMRRKPLEKPSGELSGDTTPQHGQVRTPASQNLR